MKEAHLPRIKTLEEFDFAQSPHIPAARIRALGPTKTQGTFLMGTNRGHVYCGMTTRHFQLDAGHPLTYTSAQQV
jgi:hypothetical protein